MRAAMNFITWGVFLTLVHHIVNGAGEGRIRVVEYSERNSQEVLLVQAQIRHPIGSRFQIY